MLTMAYRHNKLVYSSTCQLVNYPFTTTTVNCDLSPQLTCLLVNLSTRQLPLYDHYC